MGRYKVGNTTKEIEIRDNWLVLDAGSGDNPHPRADALLEKSLIGNIERAGRHIRISRKGRFVIGDVQSMPFKDKKFDYVIATHIAEHVDRPGDFLKELTRIGYRGYIETPSKLSEIILGETYHKSYVYVRKGKLIFEKIGKYPLLLRLIRNFLYALYYMSELREGRKTIVIHNKYMNYFLYKIAKAFRHSWPKMRNLNYTCYEW